MNPPLVITKLELSNVKRISAVSISPEGNLIVIGGENAQGKTSILDAIQMTLAGKKCVMPIRQGAKSGKSTIDLGEYIVTRTFTESGGSLTIKNRDGAAFASPQAMLDKLTGAISFDPLAFTKQKPKDQLETLRALVGVDTGQETWKAVTYLLQGPAFGLASGHCILGLGKVSAADGVPWFLRLMARPLEPWEHLAVGDLYFDRERACVVAVYPKDSVFGAKVKELTALRMRRPGRWFALFIIQMGGQIR